MESDFCNNARRHGKDRNNKILQGIMIPLDFQPAKPSFHTDSNAPRQHAFCPRSLVVSGYERENLPTVFTSETGPDAWHL